METNELIKDFLSNWRRAKGNFDLTTLCDVCGDPLKDGNFALVDGVLVCLRCKENGVKK